MNAAGQDGRRASAFAPLMCPVHPAPAVEIRYAGLTKTVVGSVDDDENTPPRNIVRDVRAWVASSASALSSFVRGKPPAPEATMPVLQHVTGVLRPGTATLLLASPGAGTTSFLRILSGRAFPDDGCTLLFNGVTRSELERGASNGTDEIRTVHAMPPVTLTKLATYAPASDIHEPLLTVQETLSFVERTRDVHYLHSKQASLQNGCTLSPSCGPPTSDSIIRALRLEECADTYVGSAQVRGISGGQKRRVTIGETLLFDARVLALDCITSGLDASTGLAVVKHICEWARGCAGNVIMALQQPSPEILAQFDDILLLAAGRVLFHGRVSMLETYLSPLGFVRPAYMDLADFASELVADPARAAVLSLDDRGLTGMLSTGQEGAPTGAAKAGAGVGLLSHAVDRTDTRTAHRPAVPLAPSRVLLSIPALAAHWSDSPAAKYLMGDTPVLVQEARARETARARDAGSLAQRTLRWVLLQRVTPQPRTVASDGAEAKADIDSQPMADGKPVCPSVHEDPPSPPYPRHPSTFGVDLCTPSLRRRYGQAGGGSGLRLSQAWALGMLLLGRQVKLIRRNRALLFARLLNSAIMGVILATLFINPSIDEFQLRFGLALFSGIFIGFTNNAEVPGVLLARRVVYRHQQAGLYSPFAFVQALVISTLPIVLVADTVYGSLVYWPTNFVPEVSRFFFFLLVLACIDVVMASYLRCLAFAMKTQERANAIGTGIIAIWLLFAGFYIIRSQIPSWLAWLVWISPFFWSVTAIANNEFTSDRYAVIVPGTGLTAGQSFMAQYDYPYGTGVKWAGVGFLAGLWLFFILVLTPLVVKNIQHDYEPGTVRRAGDELGDAEAVAKVQAVRQSTANAAQPKAAEERGRQPEQTVSQETTEDGADLHRPPATEPAPARAPVSPPLRFPPVTLAFKNIEYDVRLPGGAMRTLLRGVSGFAQPGTLTALMGATGAGKTTLLDVLAWRKTAGSVRGTMVLNGLKAAPALLARLTAYAEQEDIHMPLATVKEALEFSAALRFVPYVEESGMAGKEREYSRTAARLSATGQRKALVTAVLHVLELDRLANRLVDSLSRGELKRLTIGVEMASNPSLLFCDEPTTGLDSKQAASVMKVLRRVARTGRTILCTLHQPSAEIFFSFDRLLLLAPGGYQVYFGPLGRHACDLVSYLESLPRVGRMPSATNPGSWMLAVLQGEAPAEEAEHNTPHLRASDEETAVAAEDSATALAVLTPLHFAYAYEDSALALDNKGELNSLLGGGEPQEHGQQQQQQQRVAMTATTATQRSWPTQLWLVYCRANADYARNTEVFLVRLGVNTFLALLFGLLFLNNDLGTFSGTQSGLGFVLGGTAFAAIVFLSSSLTVQFERRGVLYRERAARYYHAPAYSVTAFLVEIPYTALVTFVFVAICYWMAGLRPSVGSWLFFWLGSWILALFFMAVAIAYVALFPSLPVAQILGGLTISCSFLFAGLFAPASSVPAGWKGMVYAVPTYHVLRALSLNQFYCVGGAASGCPQITTVGAGGVDISVDQFTYVSDFLGVDPNSVPEYAWDQLGYALAAVGVFAAIGMLAMQFVNHQKR